MPNSHIARLLRPESDVITSRRRREAAVNGIQYWKAGISAGQQSWLGQEQTQKRVLALHQQVVDFDNRNRRRDGASSQGETLSQTRVKKGTKS